MYLGVKSLAHDNVNTYNYKRDILKILFLGLTLEEEDLLIILAQQLEIILVSTEAHQHRKLNLC